MPRRSYILRNYPWLICVFLLALGVRFLTWQDQRHEIWLVQTGVTEGYKDSARQLVAGDFKTFVSDINHFGHPPGYSIVLAGIFKIAGESNNAIHVVQIGADVIAVILIFLIALELLPAMAAVIVGLLAAISPQFAYFSVLFLPDSLVVVPILLAMYLVVRARGDQSLLKFAIAGALIGLSCWLRANALLLPLFVAALAAILVNQGRRWRAALAVLAGALLLIAPITIKNAIAYHHFIPLSLGTGQTFLEGIADYDEEGRFNIPNTDMGIMEQEAEWYNKPEYGQLLFGPDGIERERMRVKRGLSVVSSHPFWFASVMLRRGIASTRLDPVPFLAPPLGWVQRIFRSASFLPLIVIGLVILIRRREWRTLLVLLTVPAYYLIVQSALHTERRYVYVIHFFLLLPAALTLYEVIKLLPLSRKNP